MYLHDGQRRGLAAGTLKNYRSTLALFHAFTLADFESVEFVSRVYDVVERKSRSIETQNNRLNWLKAFDSWLFYNSYISIKHNFRRTRLKPKIRDIPTTEDVDRLIAELRRLFVTSQAGWKFGRWRDYAAVRILFETGMRISECMELRLGDLRVDAKGRCGVFVRGTKTEAATRVCPISSGLYEFLVDAKFTDPNLHLFRHPQTQKRKFDYINFGQKIKRVAKEIGIPAKITPHTARHKFIFDWIVNGGTAFGLMARIGHSGPQQTIYYFNQVRRLYPYADLVEDFGLLASDGRSRAVRVPPVRRSVVFEFTDEQRQQIAALIEAGLISPMKGGE